MNLAAIAIEKRAVTYFAAFLLVAAGIASFLGLGQLEDPEFTVKTAVVTTGYPGASPDEVELEVTDRIELAIQEMSEIDYLESFSREGYSLIKVNIKSEYWSDRLPQVWDELRRKVRDIEGDLPPGVERPVVSDDFGDVFGFQLALTGDGFSYADLERYAKILKKEISLVQGVARVDLWGVQQKVIYLDVSEAQLSQLGITDKNIEATLQDQNVVVDAGHVDVQTNRFRIGPTGEFTSPEDIGNLRVRPTLFDTLRNLNPAGGRARSDELIRVEDIATVSQGYLDPPINVMYFNGEPAIGISITNVSGINVVDMGRGVDLRLEEVIEHLPIGIELHKVHWQSDVVDEAVSGFMINFAEAVGIVLVVLAVFMGWRMGLIIGMALIATVLVSFMLMKIFGIDLQRMSLGALVIALGMMVDNAIVVADGYVVRLGKGMAPKDAAIEAARLPAWPLLGATVVAVMAFYPVYASVEDAGEYCRTLFSVVAISLLVSWLISMTLTPMQCIDLIKPKTGDEGAAKDPYDSRFYRVYRGFLETAIRLRFLTVGCMIGLLFLALYGFGSVSQQFFPDSSMTKFMIDYWGPEGTRIQQVSRDLDLAGERLIADERVSEVAAYIGQGPPRFYLPVDPENPYQSYGQLIVNVHDFRDIDALPCRRIHGLVQRKLPAVLGRDPKIRRRAQQYLEVRAANQRAGGRRPGGFARTCRRGPADFGRRAAQRLFPHRLAYTGAEDRPAVQSGTRPLGRGFARRSGQCHQARIRWAYDWPLP
jgi:multidrug efflux pump subunit AcrB